MYYSMREHRLLGYKKSSTKYKKYDALIENKETKKKYTIPFGDTRYENYQDKTGLNLYPVHKDEERRKSYKARHKVYLKDGFYSPSYFAYYILW